MKSFSGGRGSLFILSGFIEDEVVTNIGLCHPGRAESHRGGGEKTGDKVKGYLSLQENLSLSKGGPFHSDVPFRKGGGNLIRGKEQASNVFVTRKERGTFTPRSTLIEF